METSGRIRQVGLHREGTVRWLTVLPSDTRIRYRSIVAAAAPRIEAALRPSVLANRVQAASPDPPVLRLRPWRVERRAFQRALGTLAGRDAVLAFADVRACFPSIARPAVIGALGRLGCPAEAEALDTFLGRLAAEGVVGLPVGPEPSAVLANAVLASADDALAEAGVPNLRWVDDVVVAAPDESSALAGVNVFGEALRELGLALNTRKTRIVVDPASLARHVRVSAVGAPSGVG